jgi:hypothetical protein
MRAREGDTNLSRGLGDLPITSNPRWGGFKPLICISIKYALLQQEGLAQEQLDLKLNQYLEPLQTSIPLELFFTAPTRRAQYLSQEHWSTFTIFLKGSQFLLLQVV